MAEENILKKAAVVSIDITNTTREAVSRELCKDLGCSITQTDNPEVFKLKDSADKIWTVDRNPNIKAVKLQENGTPVFAGSEYQVRVNSPPTEYKNSNALELAFSAMKCLNASTGQNYKCGVTFQINADEYTPRKIQNIVNVFSSRQKLIFKSLSLEEKHTQYFSKLNTQFSKTIYEKNPQTIPELQQIWNEIVSLNPRPDERYIINCGLNIDRFFTDKVIQFTFSGKNLVWERVQSLMALCLAMDNEALKRNRTKFIEASIDNEKFAIRTWLNRIGLKGLKFKRQRKYLMENLSGNSAWRSGQAPA